MGGFEKLTHSRFLLATTFLVGAFLLLWWNPQRVFQPVRGILSTVTYPFQIVSAWSAYQIGDMREFISSVGNLKSENNRLLKENQKLSAEIAHLTYLQSENRELRKLVDLSREGKERVLSAEVIARDGSGLSTTLSIDRGASQGVREGMAVVSGEKVLVGRIEEVFPTTAIVRLLPSPESIVSAAVATNDSKGVVRGDHGLGMIFDLALQSEDLKVGAAIVSSGLGDGMPPGILIGTIESTRPSADRLFQQAIIVTPIRFDTLRFVAVIIP